MLDSHCSRMLRPWLRPMLKGQRFCATATTGVSVEYNSANQTISYLRAPGREVILIGTAHISSSSAQEVRDMIVKERPSGVMVELCPKRIQKIRDGGFGDSPGRLGEMLKVLLRGLGSGGGLPMQGLLEQALKGFYGNFKSMGIEPGAEFKNAIEAAEEVGAKYLCGLYATRRMALLKLES
ncbi:hypothetical protein FOZ60_011203 [Perkinsus olseni]|uniref:TraB domain-containing protein n=1 Tax=Perkinsus olseni TaxID=32597 RepID=A0A7J6NDS5_PEROL|nr:hypothetical protein FOZ60_011203 [Perkinsus olseni]